jgi:hypothetical protein
MQLYNKITGSYPIVLHSPGVHGTTRRLFQAAGRLPTKKKFSGATIITWNSTNQKSLLERHQSCVVLGKGVSDWVNSMKISLASDFASSISTEYVMGFDGFDVLVFDPQGVVDRFKELDCGMLLATDRTFFPCGAEAITKPWKRFQEDVGRGRYRYLNGGAWVARTTFYRTFIEECVCLHSHIRRWVASDELPPNIPSYYADCSRHLLSPKRAPDTSEQMVLNGVFSDLYPQVQLDYDCSIFQTLNACEDVELVCNQASVPLL